MIASLGQLIREVALYWLAYEITGSAFALGILGVCEATPRLLLYPFIGVLIDRYDRLRLLIVVQFAITVPVTILAVLFYADLLEFWHILILETIFSIIRALNPSASQSLIRDLVPENELLNAVALFSIGFNFARIMGPSIGGILILWIGVGGCFLIHTITLLISGWEMLLMRLPKKPVAPSTKDFLQEVKDGFHYIWNEPSILISIGVAYVISVFVGTYQRFLPVFAKEILKVGPSGLGILMAAPGLGAVLSLAAIATAGEKWRRETLLWVTATVTPIFLILFCMSSNIWISSILLALVGGAQSACRTISRVILQIRAPYGFLGRVMSVFQMDQGLRSIGSILTGTAASLFGAAIGLGLTSFISLICTSAIFIRIGLNRIRS